MIQQFRCPRCGSHRGYWKDTETRSSGWSYNVKITQRPFCGDCGALTEVTHEWGKKKARHDMISTMSIPVGIACAVGALLGILLIFGGDAALGWLILLPSAALGIYLGVIVAKGHIELNG